MKQILKTQFQFVFTVPFSSMFFFLSSPHIPKQGLSLCSPGRPGIHSVAQVDLELKILLPQPPKCWDYSDHNCASPHSWVPLCFVLKYLRTLCVCVVLGIELRVLYLQSFCFQIVC
jgi:hypothetical protein